MQEGGETCSTGGIGEELSLPYLNEKIHGSNKDERGKKEGEESLQKMSTSSSSVYKERYENTATEQQQQNVNFNQLQSSSRASVGSSFHLDGGLLLSSSSSKADETIVYPAADVKLSSSTTPTTQLLPAAIAAAAAAVDPNHHTAHLRLNGSLPSVSPSATSPSKVCGIRENGDRTLEEFLDNLTKSFVTLQNQVNQIQSFISDQSFPPRPHPYALQSTDSAVPMTIASKFQQQQQHKETTILDQQLSVPPLIPPTYLSPPLTIIPTYPSPSPLPTSPRQCLRNSLLPYAPGEIKDRLIKKTAHSPSLSFPGGNFIPFTHNARRENGLPSATSAASMPPPTAQNFSGGISSPPLTLYTQHPHLLPHVHPATFSPSLYDAAAPSLASTVEGGGRSSTPFFTPSVPTWMDITSRRERIPPLSFAALRGFSPSSLSPAISGGGLRGDSLPPFPPAQPAAIGESGRGGKQEALFKTHPPCRLATILHRLQSPSVQMKGQRQKENPSLSFPFTTTKEEGEAPGAAATPLPSIGRAGLQTLWINRMLDALEESEASARSSRSRLHSIAEERRRRFDVTEEKWKEQNRQTSGEGKTTMASLTTSTDTQEGVKILRRRQKTFKAKITNLHRQLGDLICDENQLHEYLKQRRRRDLWFPPQPSGHAPWDEEVEGNEEEEEERERMTEEEEELEKEELEEEELEKEELEEEELEEEDEEKELEEEEEDLEYDDYLETGKFYFDM